MAKIPEDRSIPSSELIEKSGGRLIGFYFCFGKYDGVALAEAPNAATPTAISIAAAALGT